MCESCQRREATDARFWRTIRRALMMIAGAIGDRYPEPKRHLDKAA